MISAAVKNLLRPLRRGFRVMLGRDVRFKATIRCNRERHGSDYGGWFVCPDGLGPGSVVYSFGIGEDISFDLSLIARHGLTIDAFDPTPKSLAWLRTQSLPEQFVPHDYGIAAENGNAKFFAPDNPEYVSHTMLADTYGSRVDTIDVPVRRLASIMAELGHERIDILKMDVEGAEYDVLVDILDGTIDIGQILVEFHHRFASVGPEKTRRAVALLESRGYRLFHASASGEEYSFLKVNG